MKRTTLILPAMILGITIVLSFCLGQYHFTTGDLLAFINWKLSGTGRPPNQQLATVGNVLLDIRLPRIFAAVIIGASLSVSGASFQALFINPLVSPGILGVLAGASFGAAFGMLFGKSWLAVQASTIVFGFVAVGAAVGITKVYRQRSIIILVLGGIISGSFFTALLSLVKYTADPYNQLPAIVYWLMGSLAMVDTNTVLLAIVPAAAGLLAILFHARHLNIMSMGEEEAHCLGINVYRVRLIIIIAATLISAITVVIGGMIGWVGLIIPHVCRILFGPDNEVLLPAAALVGAIYLLIIDNISRLAFSFEIPIGIITAIIGIPFFALVLKNSSKGWR